MSNILVISGHPNLAQSTANAAILEEVSKALPSAEVRRLDALYPHFQIDVEAEQAALAKANVIVWQFPVNWYHMPAILQKWLSDVFTYGFAYGSSKQLEGKKLIVSLTTASPADAYQHDGAQNYTMEELGYGYKQTAHLCGLEFLGIIHSGGMLYIPGVNADADRAAVIEKAQAHAQRLVAALQ